MKTDVKAPVLSLPIDGPSKIFDFLKKTFSGENEKEIITMMDTYTVTELSIPRNGPGDIGCSIGLRTKPHEQGQVFCVWSRTPMGTEKDDEVNAMDPSPILVIETFPEDSKSGLPGMKLDYKIGTVTSGAIMPVLKMLEAVQSAVAFTFLEKK